MSNIKKVVNKNAVKDRCFNKKLIPALKLPQIQVGCYLESLILIFNHRNTAKGLVEKIKTALKIILKFKQVI